MSKRRQDDDDSHPWASRNYWFPDDIFLRECGYKIWSRPIRGPVLWLDPWGEVVSQAAALETAQAAREIKAG